MAKLEDVLKLTSRTKHETIYQLSIVGAGSVKFYIRHPRRRVEGARENPVVIIPSVSLHNAMTAEDYTTFIEACCFVESAAAELRNSYLALVEGTENLDVY